MHWRAQDPANPKGQAGAATALYFLVIHSGLEQRVRDAALPALEALLQVLISHNGSGSNGTASSS